MSSSLLCNPTRIVGDEQGNVKGWSHPTWSWANPTLPDGGGLESQTAASILLDVSKLVIMAIGTSPNPLIKSTTEGLATQPWGGIIVDEATGQPTGRAYTQAATR